LEVAIAVASVTVKVPIMKILTLNIGKNPLLPIIHITNIYIQFPQRKHEVNTLVRSSTDSFKVFENVGYELAVNAKSHNDSSDSTLRAHSFKVSKAVITQ
jgi:hypothetical protein